MNYAVLVAAALAAACTTQRAPGHAPDDAAATGRIRPTMDPAAIEGPLTHHIWVRTDSSGLPGRMLTFMPDGTLLHDSCWETYRLSRWAREGADTVRWEEDGMPIRAAVTSLTDSTLGLRLLLVGGAEDQQFRAAAAPYVCPEMRR